MICPQCIGMERQFGERHARRELKRYLRRGPMTSTRRLIEALKSGGEGRGGGGGVEGSSLLDVGGGIGVIQLELLQAGAQSAVDVEAAPAYIEVAHEEAARRGLADRITYLRGDFAELADHLEHADIVTLDRVICCYPDMPALLGRSAAHARRRLGLVYPRTHWLMRLARPIVNLVSRLRRCPFRFYLHSPAAIDDLIRSAGFVSLHQSHTPLWNIAVYGRNGDPLAQ